MKIKEGDVVELNSGGPRMTVSRLYDIYNTVTPIIYADVTWFDEENKFQSAVFAVAALKKVSE